MNSTAQNNPLPECYPPTVMAQYAVEADVLIKNPFFLHFLVSHPFGLSSELREQPYMQQDELGKYALQPELQIRLQCVEDLLMDENC